MNQWNNELKKSGIDSPADPAMNQQADQDQIERIVERGRNTVSDTVSTVRAQSEQPKQPFLEQLYQEYKTALVSEELGTTARQQKTWLSRKLKENGQKFVIAEITKLSEKWLSRAESEGVIQINPEYTPDNRKPKYLVADKYKSGYAGTAEHQLKMV